MLFNERESESDGERMGPDEAGNVQVLVSLEVTYSHAMKQEREFADVENC